MSELQLRNIRVTIMILSIHYYEICDLLQRNLRFTIKKWSIYFYEMSDSLWRNARLNLKKCSNISEETRENWIYSFLYPKVNISSIQIESCITANLYLFFPLKKFFHRWICNAKFFFARKKIFSACKFRSVADFLLSFLCWSYSPTENDDSM